MTEIKPLIGHKKQQNDIIKLMTENKLPHAILIHGSKGIGKAKFAEHLGLMIICGRDQKISDTLFSFDKLSPNFQRIQSGSLKELSAVKPLEGKKQITVEQIREIINDLSLKSETPRVIIIDSADDLNKNSANAILKTLEEPPSNTIMILLSSCPAKLLPTINSRCRRFKLNDLSPSQVEQILHQEEFSSEDIDKILNLNFRSVDDAVKFIKEGDIITDIITSLIRNSNINAYDIIQAAEKLSSPKIDENLVYSQIKEFILNTSKQKLHMGIPSKEKTITDYISNRLSLDQLTNVYQKITEIQNSRNSLNINQTACLEKILSLMFLRK